MKPKKSIKNLTPYQTSTKTYQYKLDANETNQLLFDDLELSLEVINRYPEVSSQSLRKTLAKTYALDETNLIVGNGTDELLDLLVKTFTNPNETLIAFKPSFSMYKVYAQINNANFIEISLTKTFDFPLNEIDKYKNHNPKIIFLCSPNNPTGTTIKRDKIIDLLVRYPETIIVVDEAYIEFYAEEKSLIKEVTNYSNLVVTRTFSKAYGLAGIRLGYLAAKKSIIMNLLKVKLPYNLNRLSAAIGSQVLVKKETLKAHLELIKKEREKVFNVLHQLKINVIPSKANFLFFQTSYSILKPLQKKGIIIRSFNNNYYRVTIGNSTENTLFCDTLKEVYNERSNLL
ncbi:MAG: histidinol-phosphate transaminase [Candidatus Izimaplasma sp.]|nr:histidinol-phosphate transaminase [Candidatus Izimaplasma bacterium]